jgi:hypothetical protein
VAGENFSTRPKQEMTRKPRGHGDQRAQDDVNEAKRLRQQKAESIWEKAEKSFGQQFAKNEKQEDRRDEGKDFPDGPPVQAMMQGPGDEREDREIDHGVSHENCPKKVFGVFQKSVQDGGATIARAHELANSEPVECEHARFDSGK